MLSNDDKELLNLIASSNTSPFKKQVVQNQANQSHENSSVGESLSEKDGNSSVNTPKFANSFTSATPPRVEDIEQGTINDPNNIFHHTEVKEKEKKIIQT